MRSIDDLVLDLADPTVLIGVNGAGKSTIIEACELLRKVGSERPFVSKLLDVHGGPSVLLRHGAKKLQLAVTLRSDRAELRYELTLRNQGAWLTIEHEAAYILQANQLPRVLLERRGSQYTLPHPDARTGPQTIADDEVVLTAVAFQAPEVEAIRAALASIEVHCAPDTRPAWTSSASELGMRSSNVIRPITRVEPGGRNLPNVYHALRDQADWPETLARIQLALGDRIEAITTPVDPSGGRIGLALRITGVGEIASFAMSEGQLAYLALVGILRLKRPTPPSLVAFDEPDLHLHPGLVRRMTADLEIFARQTSVLIATQSDALLDALEDPARCAVLCDLDDRSATRCLRPDAGELQHWLERYRGLGELRGAGYEELVFPALEPQ